MIFSPFRYSELARFFSAGILSTVIHYLVLLTLYSNDTLSLTTSTLVTFTFAITFSYIANYCFMFKSRNKHTTNILKFVTTSSNSLTLSILVFRLLIKEYRIHLELTFIATTILVIVSNYSMNKLWVFHT